MRNLTRQNTTFLPLSNVNLLVTASDSHQFEATQVNEVLANFKQKTEEKCANL